MLPALNNIQTPRLVRDASQSASSMYLSPEATILPAIPSTMPHLAVPPLNLFKSNLMLNKIQYENKNLRNYEKMNKIGFSQMHSMNSSRSRADILNSKQHEFKKDLVNIILNKKKQRQ